MSVPIRLIIDRLSNVTGRTFSRGHDLLKGFFIQDITGLTRETYLEADPPRIFFSQFWLPETDDVDEYVRRIIAIQDAP
jgi:hypothetical protein